MIFRFANPELLWLLLLIPILLILQGRRGRKAAVTFPSAQLAANVLKSSKSRAGFISLLLRSLCLTSLIVALARPQTGDDITEIKASGIDIVLAVDISGSMLALDMGTESNEQTRLDVVKDVIADFINARPTDRIGFVAFATDPYLVSPITLNHDWLNKNLSRLEVGLVESGTNIGKAIGMSTNRLRSLKSKSRIIILLTDGKDSVQGAISPKAYAQAAANLGVKIYTIAAGKQERVRTYFLDNRTGKIARDRFGRKLIDIANFPIDEEILKEIAKTTGGKFYRARDQKSLKNIYQEIDQLEKTDVKMNIKRLYNDHFHYPLWLGLGFLLLEIFLNKLYYRRLP